MKTSLLLFSFFITISGTAQNKQYYNYQGKPCDVSEARYVSLTDKTDSGWVRRDFFLSTKKSQMKGLYTDSTLKTENGWFRYFYVNMVLSSQGQYVKGKKDGLWLSYYYTGQLKDSVLYDKGYLINKTVWHSNGIRSDSSVYHVNGTADHVSWFDNGQLSHNGQTYMGRPDGRWQYFHKNGKPAAMEEYKQAELVNSVYYNEEGQPVTGSISIDQGAVFKGGQKKWQAFLFNNLDVLDEVKLKNTNAVTVVLALTIDEEGNVTDAYVDVPVSPKFDEAALKVIKKSPRWIPAIHHNRHVKYSLRQSITFNQYD